MLGLLELIWGSRESNFVSRSRVRGAETNICHNALDRNVELGHGDKVAFYWVGNEPKDRGQVRNREWL